MALSLSREPENPRHFVCLLALLGANPAYAQDAAEEGASICEAASYAAAQELSIPPDVMLAISLTETGRRQGGRLRPWPLTVNIEGAGHWFDAPAEALELATKRYGEGARSFDVGCFQLNYRWHGMHFTSIEAMFDPMTNARNAAQFLSNLYAELGSWSAAAGAYHSRTPSYANRYSARFDEIRTRLGGAVAEQISLSGEAGRYPAVVTTTSRRRIIQAVMSAQGIRNPVFSFEEVGANARPALLGVA